MSTRPGIAQDIRRVRQMPPRQRTVPLPAGAPRRQHVVSQATTQVPRVQAKVRLKAWEIAQYPLLAGVALGAAASSTFGQAILLAYAVVVLAVKRQPSQLSFGLALILLLAVPLFQLIGQPAIAENAAIYVYELLVIGTIAAILELKHKT